MRILTSLLLPTIPTGLFAAFSGQPAEDSDVVLTDRTTISSDITATNITVPEGAVVIVDASVTLHATENFEIFGRIVVEDVAGLDLIDAPSLALFAGERLTIHGSIAGGTGRNLEHVPALVGKGLEGGDGSTISLEAPDLWITGIVEAGHGGNGGRGADGGDGGWVMQVGRLVTDSHALPSYPILDEEFTACKGGDGGRGGNGITGFGKGGDGGDAGSVSCEIHPNEPTWQAEGTGDSGGGFAALLPNVRVCNHGADGMPPGRNVGGVAGDGGHGDDGTVGSPKGEDGGDAGHAPSVSGAFGQKGQGGGNCCGEQVGAGGNGGEGSKSGEVVGRKGGTGGNGGEAYRVDGESPYLAKGGDAGNGGNGAPVTVQKGADGGRGGDGEAPGDGGDGGGTGDATPGPMGPKGKRGAGLPNGAPGINGSSGSTNGGGNGDPGDPGDNC